MPSDLTGAAVDETAGYAKGPSAAGHFEQTVAQGLELLLDGRSRLRKKT